MAIAAAVSSSSFQTRLGAMSLAPIRGACPRVQVALRGVVCCRRPLRFFSSCGLCQPGRAVGIKTSFRNGESAKIVSSASAAVCSWVQGEAELEKKRHCTRTVAEISKRVVHSELDFLSSSIHQKRMMTTTRAVSHDAEVVEVENSECDTRVPVTVITGFLGSGKTTLVNHVLTGQHGKRIAVIENEFGEVDIDGSLVAAQKSGVEDIVMLNNGCLCCTVRGDLVRLLSELVKTKRSKFDHILVETTGLANPLPIIQTFFLEEQLAMEVKLDGVVTLVDAKHATQHIEEVKPEGVVNEAVEQIAYADRIILNKTDLVGEPEINALMRQIKRINGLASVKKATYGSVDMDYVIGVGGYDLEKVEAEVLPAPKEEHSHSEHEHSHHEHEHDHHHEHSHTEAHSHEHEHKNDNHAHDHAHEHEHEHDHVHDPGVSSVSIVCGGNLDLDKINVWLEDLLDENSDDIYRMKGVLSIEGFEARFVFQGVHALFEGSPDRPWREDEERSNKIVFIGRDLNEQSLRRGFMSCLA